MKMNKNKVRKSQLILDTEVLISLMKREFGNNWQNVFCQTVRIELKKT